MAATILFASILVCAAITTCSAKPLQVANEDERPCSVQLTQRCSSISAAQNYSMKLSSTEYFPSQTISVKVYASSCSHFSDHGPQWYTLQALHTTTKEDNVRQHGVGEFLQRVHRSEAQLCEHESKVIFSTCEPSSLDLPGNYEWKAPTKAVGKICFRLTVQTGGASGCEVVEQCITPIPASSGDGSGFSDDFDTFFFELGSTDYTDYDHDDHGSGFDEVEDSGKHRNQSEHDDAETTTVTNSESYEPTPICLRDRNELLDWGFYWVPTCDCLGYYKLIQCVQYPFTGGDTECWCSTKMGGEIVNSRRKLVCSEPEEFSFLCGT